MELRSFGFFVLTVITAALAAAADEPILAGKTPAPEQQARLEERNRWEKESKEFEKAGKLADAVAAAEKMLAIEREVYGDNHREVAASWLRLGELHTERDDWSAARHAYQRMSAVLTQLYGVDDWRVADTRLLIADTDLYSRLSMSELTAARHASQLVEEGVQFMNNGRFADARGRFHEALKIRNQVIGVDHHLSVSVTKNLGETAHRAGNYQQARTYLCQAVEGDRRVYGPATLRYAVSLQNLAILNKDTGEFILADISYREILKIYRRCLPDNDTAILSALNNHAAVLWDMGDLRRAGAVFSEVAGATLGATAGDRLLVRAQTLNNLGLIYETTGRPVEAEPLLQEAAELSRTVFGEGNSHYHACLNNLALTCQSLNKSAVAENIYQKVLGLKERAIGKEHPSYATGLTGLAQLYRDTGRVAEAEPLLRQALEIDRTALGTTHFKYAGDLSALAWCLLASGQPEKAGPLARESLTVSLGALDRTADAQSELGQVRLEVQNRGRLAAYLQFAAGGSPGDNAYALALRWKGQAFVRQRRRRELARAVADPATNRLAADLLATTHRLSALSGLIPSPEQAVAWRKQVTDLTNRREELEVELTEASAAFRSQKERETVTPEQLRRSLPAGTALVDFFAYRHVTSNRTATIAWVGEDRLIAFVVRPDRDVVRVELGPFAPIAAGIAAWRDQVIRAGSTEGAVLRKTLWDPLAPHLTGADTVLISPDRELATLPFAALPGAKLGSYLIEDVAVAVLPVPQFLLDPIASANADKAPTLLVVGDVDYDAGAGKPTIEVSARTAPRVRSAGGTKWSRLPGTKVEALDVRDLFRARFPGSGLTLLVEESATEDGVRTTAPAARYLHLATHGFFAPPAVPAAARADGGPDDRTGVGATGGYHPGLLSGLVLTGANVPVDPLADADDGILTALEVNEMDLRECELVVLSACETGLGQMAGGEGILGLQRAFAVAGARTAVTSLWQIPDQPTAALMDRFYRNLWDKKMGKLAALREAQQWMLRDGAAKPGVDRGIRRVENQEPAASGLQPAYYWAAFSLSGDWR